MPRCVRVKRAADVHRTLTLARVAVAQDDFEVLGLDKHTLPTKGHLKEAQRKRIFSIRTDHYDGSTREAGWYATQAHLKVHAAVARLMKHPAIVEDWATWRRLPAQRKRNRSRLFR